MLRKENALVVVAIDFGTTYSGYAWSFRHEYEKDHAKIYNDTWKSGVSLGTPKTPTSILFDKDAKFVHFGYDAENEYINLLETGRAGEYYFFTKFKMKLFQREVDAPQDKSQRNTKLSLDLVMKDKTGKQMDALKVFSESIRYLKDKFLKSGSVAHFEFEENDIHWILTIPAIWKDNAKQFMRKAAIMSGIKNEMLSLAYEPEAAAIYLKDATVQRKVGAQGCSLSKFDSGQKFMVLDCGGGTIDITSYEIQNNSVLKELDSPSGGLWGGTCVDQEFLSFMQTIFGSDVWDDFTKREHEDLLDLERKFEEKKRSIEPNSQREIFIPFPVSLYETFSRLRQNVTFAEYLKTSKFSSIVTQKKEKLIFKPETVEQFFCSIDNIITHVNALLSESYKKGNNIKAILMAGGYSDSAVMQERVRREFKSCDVICPQDAVLAVVKGAVMFGHNPQLIGERICPRTYGIASNVPFNHKKDPYTHRCLVEGREMCTDVFKIMVRKGDSLIVGKTSYVILCNPSYSRDTQAIVEVYESTEEEPQYTTDESVKGMGFLTVPIPDVKMGKSRLIRIEMHFGNTELFVTASEEGTGRKADAKFNCMMK